MKITKATKTETEADLEARARVALLRAFPWLKDRQIEQQITFTLRFGHAVITVKGREKEWLTGRVDMVVRVDGDPLLVLELKRKGLGVTQEDVEQGLSYARVMHPRPPLVLATDGNKKRIVETHTGADWTPTDRDGKAVKALLDNVAMVAADDMKRAVSRLLSDDPALWARAADAVTGRFIEERTGGWADQDLPFVKGFLFPREAVKDALEALAEGSRLILLEGEALGGKSSALRELADRLAHDENFVVMVLDADSGIDLFAALADIWSAHFAWPLTRHEARHWTQQLSQTNGPRLVLAIDDFDGDRGGFRRDLEALTSDLFGERIRIVLAVEPHAAQNLMSASNGRTPSTLRRRAAKRFTVGKLSDIEFGHATALLRDRGVFILKGGQHTPELRLPWVLRAMAAGPLSRTRAPNSVAVLGSVPSLDLLGFSRRAGHGAAVGARRYREIAEAVYADALSDNRSPELRLDALERYLIRRETLRSHLHGDEIVELSRTGLLRESRSMGGEAVFSVQHPILLADQLTKVTGVEIRRSEDSKALAADLLQLAGSVPLGPIVVAAAIADEGLRANLLDYDLLRRLLEAVPRRETLPDGAVFAFRLPDGQHLDLKVVGDRIEVELDGKTQLIEPGEEGLGSTVSGVEAWNILPHLATRRMAADAADGSTTARYDIHLMLTIGSYPGLLLEVGGRDELLGLPMHDLPGGGEVLCVSAGVIEPITFAMYLLFARERELADRFVAAALEQSSAALMMRIAAAMQIFLEDDDELRALYEAAVLPAIEHLLDHGPSPDGSVD